MERSRMFATTLRLLMIFLFSLVTMHIRWVTADLTSYSTRNWTISLSGHFNLCDRFPHFVHHVLHLKSVLIQMQGNLWPGTASSGGGSSGAACVLGTDSSCMRSYSHPHSNLPSFMSMPTSPSHPHHHHPPHHHGINGLYSLHGFPGGLGPPSIDGPDGDFKPTGLVALRMKAKDPGSIISWPT